MTKKTKREMFNEIRAMVIDNDEMVAFIDHELELLDRKSKSPRKPTKVQVENETYKQNIYDTLDMADTAITMKELFELCEPIQGLTTQRVTHILTSLINDGKVTREIIKKVRYYKAVA